MSDIREDAHLSYLRGLITSAKGMYEFQENFQFPLTHEQWSDISKALAFYERFQEALPVLESIANAPEEFDHDLVFDETEGGGTGMWGYYGLITDYLSPADILIRFKRGDDEEGTKTIALANEVVKRWNARDTISKLIKEVG